MGRIAGVTAEETRERLVTAAASIVAEQGYDGARVGDIAREAGLTTGAIYAHFRTKAELLAEAVQDRNATELSDLLGTGGAPASTVIELLTAFGERLARPGRDRGAALLVESVVAARRDADVAGRIREGVSDRERGFAEVVQAAADAGGLDATLPADALARLGLTLALGSLVVRALDLDPVDPDGWSSVVDRLVTALLPTPESS